MNVLNTLSSACFADNPDEPARIARQEIARWDAWLLPVSAESPAGSDPGYDDDFERMREEVNKLSGADTELICTLAEKLLMTVCKDVRVATYYLWARLHKEGGKGLADALALLAGMLIQYQDTLLPERTNSRKAAIEWLAGQRVLDSLSLYPEVERQEFSRAVALLISIQQTLDTRGDIGDPELGPLYSALEKRLALSGGADSVVPQNISSEPARNANTAGLVPGRGSQVQSGRELLDQAKSLAMYLRSQSDGWLAGHRLMKTVRWDTLHQLPPQNHQGCTRLSPPRTEARAQLKRLYLQQSWGELTEQADRLFAEGVNHFWLDVQWYLYQALSKSPSPRDGWADVIKADLKLFLTRLPGLEMLAWEDGTPFADEVTLGWINQQILEESNFPAAGFHPPAEQTDEDSVLALEQEALAQADSEGIEAALRWLQSRPDTGSPRNQWLLHLVMARVADQFARYDLALNLLRDLDCRAAGITLACWEPQYLFEIKARQLQLLRGKSQRSGAGKAGTSPEMEALLAELTALDPVRAAILYP